MSEKPVWYASGGRKSKPTFSKFVPMLASTPHIKKQCTWRPSWLKNLEQDISIDNKLDNYVMARGGTIQLGRSSKKIENHTKGEESKQKTEDKKAKWTPKWLWNNHGIEKHSFKRQPRDEEQVQLAYDSWKNELANRERQKRTAKLKVEREKEEEERLRFTRNIQKNISYTEFCKEAKKANTREKQRLRKIQEKMEKEWADRLEQKQQQIKLMKMKNAIFRKEQKRRTKKGPPGSRKPLKLKKSEKYFAKEKKGDNKSRSVSVLSPQKQNATGQVKPRAKSAMGKRNRRDRMSQGDITALYRLSVSPLVNPPKRHGNWQAIRPTSAPKGMPRFLKRLENTTDAPLDMRKPIKKALRRATSALEIRVTPPRYPAPKLKRKLPEHSLGSSSKDRKNSNATINMSESSSSNDNIMKISTQESKAIESAASIPTVDDSMGNMENKSADDNAVKSMETKEDALARQERYARRRLAAEKTEQEEKKTEENAKAKAMERMRQVKERDAINKAKEEEEMRIKEMQEIERRLKVNEEKLARRKKAFKEKEKEEKLEEERLQESQMRAAEQIQRIGRGKLARKSVQKLKEDRKKDLQNGMEKKESNKEDVESLTQEKQTDAFCDENNHRQYNDGAGNTTTDHDGKSLPIESSNSDSISTNNEEVEHEPSKIAKSLPIESSNSDNVSTSNNEEVEHELSKIGDKNDTQSTKEVVDAPAEESML